MDITKTKTKVRIVYADRVWKHVTNVFRLSGYSVYPEAFHYMQNIMYKEEKEERLLMRPLLVWNKKVRSVNPNVFYWIDEDYVKICTRDNFITRTIIHIIEMLNTLLMLSKSYKRYNTSMPNHNDDTDSSEDETYNGEPLRAWHFNACWCPNCRVVNQNIKHNYNVITQRLCPICQPEQDFLLTSNDYSLVVCKHLNLKDQQTNWSDDYKDCADCSSHIAHIYHIHYKTIKYNFSNLPDIVIINITQQLKDKEDLNNWIEALKICIPMIDQWFYIGEHLNKILKPIACRGCKERFEYEWELIDHFWKIYSIVPFSFLYRDKNESSHLRDFLNRVKYTFGFKMCSTFLNDKEETPNIDEKMVTKMWKEGKLRNLDTLIPTEVELYTYFYPSTPKIKDSELLLRIFLRETDEEYTYNSTKTVTNELNKIEGERTFCDVYAFHKKEIERLKWETLDIRFGGESE